MALHQGENRNFAEPTTSILTEILCKVIQNRYRKPYINITFLMDRNHVPPLDTPRSQKYNTAEAIREATAM